MNLSTTQERAHQIDRVNKEIDVGMQQLREGKKIFAKDSYHRLKNIIKNIANKIKHKWNSSDLM